MKVQVVEDGLGIDRCPRIGQCVGTLGEAELAVHHPIAQGLDREAVNGEHGAAIRQGLRKGEVAVDARQRLCGRALRQQRLPSGAGAFRGVALLDPGVVEHRIAANETGAVPGLRLSTPRLARPGMRGRRSPQQV